MTCDHTAALPDELLSRFFDEWLFDDLRSVMGVSSRWRLVAMDHPVYWRFVHLVSANPRAVAIFCQRLQYTHSRPLSLSIDVRIPSEDMLAAILPIVAARVSCLETLTVQIHHSHADAILCALRARAPLLRDFFFYAYPESTLTRLSLPIDIFHSHAPALRNVTLHNVHLPDCAVPAFDHVEFVSFGYGTPLCEPTMIPNLFDLFPNITGIAIRGAPLFDALSRDVEAWRRLADFWFHGPCAALYPVIDRLPLASIRRVHMHFVEDWMSDLVLEHLSGPLELIVGDLTRNTPGTFGLCLVASNDQRVRSFTERASGWDDAYRFSHTWLHDARVFSRMALISISNTIWQLFSRALQYPLPSLRELRLLIEPEDKSIPAACIVLHCEALQYLTLRADSRTTTVSSTSILHFAADTFRGLKNPLILILESVQVHPSTENLTATFGNVLTRPLKWR